MLKEKNRRSWMIEGAGPYIGALALIAAAILTWLSTGRKTSVDESSVVFAQWKELMENHKEDMATLKEEFLAYKAAAQEQSEARNQEIEGLRKRLSEVEEKFANFRLESDNHIGLLKKENEGLRRQISQVGLSAYEQINKVAEQANATEHHLEELEPEARQEAGKINDHLGRLDRINKPKVVK